jgi:uncharacterized protein YggE
MPPDYVKILVAVVTTNPQCEAAQSENQRRVASVLEAMKAVPIPSADLSTDYVSLEKKEAELENKPPVFLGYEASCEMTIVLKDLSKYDQVMATVLKAGVNRITGIQFCLEDEPAKRKEARLKAIHAAKDKADYLAAALGQKVGRAIRIEETVNRSYSANLNTFTYEAPTVVAGTLAPKNLSITASVDVVLLLSD